MQQAASGENPPQGILLTEERKFPHGPTGRRNWDGPITGHTWPMKPVDMSRLNISPARGSDFFQKTQA